MKGYHHRPNPWRAVASYQLREGRASLAGPDTGRRGRWWELTLACGHRTEKTVRYKPDAPSERGRAGGRRRERRDVLPAPKSIRCDQCGENP